MGRWGVASADQRSRNPDEKRLTLGCGLLSAAASVLSSPHLSLILSINTHQTSSRCEFAKLIPKGDSSDARNASDSDDAIVCSFSVGEILAELHQSDCALAGAVTEPHCRSGDYPGFHIVPMLPAHNTNATWRSACPKCRLTGFCGNDMCDQHPGTAT